MDTIAITAERKAQLEDFARRHDQDPATALDHALGEYLAWEQEDFQETVSGIQRGLDDLAAGRTQPIEEALDQLRRKHAIPR